MLGSLDIFRRGKYGNPEKLNWDRVRGRAGIKAECPSFTHKQGEQMIPMKMQFHSFTLGAYQDLSTKTK